MKFPNGAKRQNCREGSVTLRLRSFSASCKFDGRHSLPVDVLPLSTDCIVMTKVRRWPSGLPGAALRWGERDHAILITSITQALNGTTIVLPIASIPHDSCRWTINNAYSTWVLCLLPNSEKTWRGTMLFLIQFQSSSWTYLNEKSQLPLFRGIISLEQANTLQRLHAKKTKILHIYVHF